MEAKGRTVMPSMMIYGLISMSPNVSSDVTVMCTFLRTASYNQGRDNYIFFEKQTSHLSGHICSCNGCDAVGTMHHTHADSTAHSPTLYPTVAHRLCDDGYGVFNTNVRPEHYDAPLARTFEKVLDKVPEKLASG